MFSSTAILSLLLSISSTTAYTHQHFHENAFAGLEVRQDSACTDVHIFMARGNGEAYPGRVGQIANAVCAVLPDVSCDSENILFNSDQAYCNQADDGVSSGISQLTAYASRCPDAKIVLAGYSLGAQIVGDIVGGGGGPFYTCTENSNSGLSPSSSPGNRISAILLFGNVRHVADQSYNVGPGSGDNGQYPRSGSQLSDLNQFSSIMQDYCLATDPICALGDDGESHTTYMDVYANQAASWVQPILLGASSGGSSSSSGSESSSEPSSTSITYPPWTSPTSSSTATTSTGESSSTQYFVSSSSSTTPAAPSSSSTFSAAASSSSSGTPESTSSSAAASSTSSAPSTTSSSSSPSSTSLSTSYSSQSINSASLFSLTATPFVFSNTATVATTSTFTPTTASSSSGSIYPTTRASSTTPSPVSTSASAPVTVATTSSSAGAGSNAVQLTLSFVSLVVIKVLLF